jgi:hypothetical protein
MNRRVLNKQMLAVWSIILLLGIALGRSEAQGLVLVTLADPIDVRTLSGQIRDPGKSAVPNAHVELFDRTGKLLASTNSDAKGNFHFESFGKSEFKLKVSMQGFNPLQATLRIQKNAPESAVLTMLIAN